jgi:hypothetical protein
VDTLRDRLRSIGRFVVVSASQGVIGGLAFLTIVNTVSPGPVRDGVLLVIWPLLIVVGGLVLWRWLEHAPSAAPTSTERPSTPVPAAATGLKTAVSPPPQPEAKELPEPGRSLDDAVPRVPVLHEAELEMVRSLVQAPRTSVRPPVLAGVPREHR